MNNECVCVWCVLQDCRLKGDGWAVNLSCLAPHTLLSRVHTCCGVYYSAYTSGQISSSQIPRYRRRTSIHFYIIFCSVIGLGLVSHFQGLYPVPYDTRLDITQSRKGFDFKNSGQVWWIFLLVNTGIRCFMLKKNSPLPPGPGVGGGGDSCQRYADNHGISRPFFCSL